MTTRDLAKTFPWLGKKNAKVEPVKVVEPSDPDWWLRPYAGHSPPAGATPGRPWFAPGADVWVDEHGFRWPRSELPEGVRLPAQPTGDEPMFELTRALADIEKGYWIDNDNEE